MLRKKYMPQAVFDAGASFIAWAHLVTGEPIEVHAAKLFVGYRNAYINDGAEHDWILAARQALTTLEELQAPAPEALLNHFRYFVQNFDASGRPRKKRLFGGTLFDQAPQNPHRKEDFLRLLKQYYVGARVGMVPLAPPGWGSGE